MKNFNIYSLTTWTDFENWELKVVRISFCYASSANGCEARFILIWEKGPFIAKVAFVIIFWHITL